ncbi:MAG: hypothetical protein MO853_05735 [Candidatus Protistobacter heckmanni]|nr:hypothetical protein [Candidatus Protistobacter heckmanni]
MSYRSARTSPAGRESRLEGNVQINHLIDRRLPCLDRPMEFLCLNSSASATVKLNPLFGLSASGQSVGEIHAAMQGWALAIARNAWTEGRYQIAVLDPAKPAKAALLPVASFPRDAALSHQDIKLALADDGKRLFALTSGIWEDKGLPRHQCHLLEYRHADKDGRWHLQDAQVFDDPCFNLEGMQVSRDGKRVALLYDSSPSHTHAAPSPLQFPARGNAASGQRPEPGRSLESLRSNGAADMHRHPVAVSPDGRQFAFIGSDKDGAPAVVAAGAARGDHSVPAYTSAMPAAARAHDEWLFYSPDGRMLARCQKPWPAIRCRARPRARSTRCARSTSSSSTCARSAPCASRPTAACYWRRSRKRQRPENRSCAARWR